MDFLAFLLMSTASILSVLFNDQGWFQVDPATLGLALTMLLQIAGTNFPWMVRQSAEVTNQMVSVERVLAFGSLPPEAALTTDFDRDCPNWPRNMGPDCFIFPKPFAAVECLSVGYRRCDISCCAFGQRFCQDAISSMDGRA